MRGVSWVLLAMAFTACQRSTSPAPPATSATSEPLPSASSAQAEPAPLPSAEATASVAAPSAAPAQKNPVAKASPSEPAALASVAAPAPSAEPARVVKTVSGASASADSFRLSISAQSPVRAGQSSAANITLQALAPYHCNNKYPYKFALDAPSGGVSYPSNPVRGMSVSEKTATMSVPFSAADKGHVRVSGTLSFSVCTEDKCMIEKRPLSVSVDVD